MHTPFLVSILAILARQFPAWRVARSVPTVCVPALFDFASLPRNDHGNPKERSQTGKKKKES